MAFYFTNQNSVETGFKKVLMCWFTCSLCLEQSLSCIGDCSLCLPFIHLLIICCCFFVCTVCQKMEKQVTTSSVFICNHSSLEKAGKSHARNWNEWISDVTITSIINIQLVCFVCQIEEEADINPTRKCRTPRSLD